MDDILILKWFGLAILLALAAVFTIVLPFHVLLFALGILIAGIVRRCKTTPTLKGDRGGSLIIFGALMMLPPIAWITSALMNMRRL